MIDWLICRLDDLRYLLGQLRADLRHRPVSAVLIFTTERITMFPKDTPVRFAVQFKDKDGNNTLPAAIPTYALDDPAKGTITVAADGLSGSIQFAVVGGFTLTMTETSSGITASASDTVIGGVATSAVLALG